MRGKISLILASAIALAAAAPGFAQEALLDIFAADSFVYFGVDVQKIMAMVPPETVAEWRAKSIDDAGFDVFERIAGFAMAVPFEATRGSQIPFYGVLYGSMSVEDIRTAAASNDNEFGSTDLNGLDVYYTVDDDGDVVYFLPVEGGMIIGQEDGMNKYKRVIDGELASAASGPISRAISIPDTSSMFYLGGYFTDQMKQTLASQDPAFGDLDLFALDAEYVADTLEMRFFVTSPNQDALVALETMLQQQLNMVKGLDETGTAAEIVDNMQYSVSGDQLLITTSVAGETLRQFFEKMRPFMDREEK